MNATINNVVEKTGVSYCDIQNAISFYKFDPSQEEFRKKYF